MRWPLPAISALLAGSGAALAAAVAWLLTALFGVVPSIAAAAGAALALLAAALPTLAVALNRLSSDAPGPSVAPVNEPVRDQDTGAFRRDVFMELAEREWSRARRYGTGAGLLVVDLDRAAALNETHGPAAADAFLANLARHTSPTLRGADLLTRLSVTQLGVFLAQADPTGALDVAERIRERAEGLDWGLALPAAAAEGSTPLRATVSVGVASLRPAHLNLQSLLHDAEDALAASRLAGGNCVRAAPVDTGAPPLAGSWRDDHRARPK